MIKHLTKMGARGIHMTVWDKRDANWTVAFNRDDDVALGPLMLGDTIMFFNRRSNDLFY